MKRLSPQSDRLPKRIRVVIVCLICVLAGLIVFEYTVWTSDGANIPGASSGNVVMFHNELSANALIDGIDATDQHIYIHFSQDVIGVYDWKGNYLNSFAFYHFPNGTLQMRVSDGLLYVNDRQHYTFIFDGQQLIDTLIPGEDGHAYVWYQDNSGLVYISNNKVYDKNGNFIMDLPGRR